MKLTYNGPNAAVQVHVGDGVYVGAEHGETVEFPASVAHELAESGDWKKPPKATEKKSDPGAEKESD